MAAVIVNIVFPGNFSVGGDINPALDLVFHRLPDSFANYLGCVFTESIHGRLPQFRGVRGVRPLGVVKPVGELHEIGLWISAYAGGF